MQLDPLFGYHDFDHGSPARQLCRNRAIDREGGLIAVAASGEGYGASVRMGALVAGPQPRRDEPGQRSTDQEARDTMTGTTSKAWLDSDGSPASARCRCHRVRHHECQGRNLNTCRRRRILVIRELPGQRWGRARSSLPRRELKGIKKLPLSENGGSSLESEDARRPLESVRFTCIHNLVRFAYRYRAGGSVSFGGHRSSRALGLDLRQVHLFGR